MANTPEKRLSVYILSVTDFDYIIDNQLEVFDGINDPITTLADTIFIIVAGELFAARRPGVAC